MRKKRLLARTRVLTLLLLLCLPALLLSLPALAQNKIISGKVTDSKDGSPIRGVSVIPQGSVRGTVTDEKGEFKISVDAASHTLVLSAVGFTTQLIPISGNTLSFSLVASNSTLNEVVVIGYGSAKRKDLTGAIATVTSKDFQTGAITSPDQLIAGKIAGVSVTSNGGAPGAGSTIRIRGLASISGNNDPLIVIDGLPLSGNSIPGIPSPLDLVNPNDIESFTVLKDAAATAIYGSRAASGVLLISTKKGKSGPAQFSFNTCVGDQTLAKKEDVLSADQLRAYVNANGTTAQKALLGTANTNWQDLIYRQAIFSSSNISVSGSLSNLMPYRISYGFLDQAGI